MPSLLDTAAVGVKKGVDASAILQEYVRTPGLEMAQNNALSVDKAAHPKGLGELIEP